MHADQFTATGPSQTGARFSRAAFSTGSGPDTGVHGVNVRGSECGIFGCSDDDSVREPNILHTGVSGRGKSFGVFGEGNQGVAGVLGLHNNINHDPATAHRPDLRPGTRTGVIGAAMQGGTGVAGVSVDRLHFGLTPDGHVAAADQFAPIPDPADGTGRVSWVPAALVSACAAAAMKGTA